MSSHSSDDSNRESSPEDTQRTRPLQVQRQMPQARHMASRARKFSATSVLHLKIAPAYDGTTSWFACEQLIDDWFDITTLDEMRGPSLKTRPSGLATVQKETVQRKAYRH